MMIQNTVPFFTTAYSSPPLLPWDLSLAEKSGVACVRVCPDFIMLAFFGSCSFVYRIFYYM